MSAYLDHSFFCGDDITTEYDRSIWRVDALFNLSDISNATLRFVEDFAVLYEITQEEVTNNAREKS